MSARPTAIRLVTTATVVAGCLAMMPSAATGVGRVLSLVTIAAQAQAPAGIVAFTVRETLGIRRTEFPVSTRVSLPRGATADALHVRLRAGDADVVAQFTPVTRWDDGSWRDVEVDFNASLGAGESRSYQVDTTATAAPETKPRGALTVTEDEAGIQVGAVKLGRTGWPLLTSVTYRGEIIGSGANGVSLIDAAGRAYPFGSEGGVQAEVVKRGPLLVTVRYRGDVTIAGTAVPVTVTGELPNSKSWLKLTVAMGGNPGGRGAAGRAASVVRGVRLETPFALGAFPWTWDFGTDTGTYGVFRSEKDRVVLTQHVNPAGARWRVETGSGTDLRVYEQSGPRRPGTVSGWGHLVDARNAIAFAVDRFARAPGTYTWTLDGQGRAAYEAAPASGGPLGEVVLYQHYVGTPVPVGAATPPAAMVSPLSVSLNR